MKYFKNYQMFAEAIDIQDVRKYLTIKRKKNVTNLLNQMFKRLKELPGSESSKRDERIYIPFIGDLDTKTEKGLIQQEIESFFSPQGIEIVDYTKGLAREGRRNMKIGKFLVKLKRQDLLKKYNNDPQREGATIQNSYIVFSRHAYDIAGMSTDRGWDSCMNIYTGEYREYVEYDIREGTIVAYLIHGDDKNINKPIARISIKPYIEKDVATNIIYFSEDKIYPSSTDPSFKTQVDRILGRIQKIKNLGSYQLNKKLYCNTRSSILVNNYSPDSLNYEEIKYILDHYRIENYTINDDLTVDVDGNVDLSEDKLKEIPVNFNYVSGSFQCSDNQLTSLKGCPKVVGDSFLANNNKLTTLEDGPRKVGGWYKCSFNQLTSLKGCPKEIGRNFDCSYNQLTSLKDGPKKVGKSFDCSQNKLTSLKGCPNEVGGIFDCAYNQLTLLEGIPYKVELFDCSNNQLTSLEGGPQEVSIDYGCSNNKLTTLKGSPKYIPSTFHCYTNQLTSLEGGPVEVGKGYDCSNNKLTTLKGSPNTVGWGFNCSDNQLTSFEGGPKKVGWSVDCRDNKMKISEDEIKNICNVDGEIYT